MIGLSVSSLNVKHFLFKNVEKLIDDCQKEIEKAQEQYIFLKHLKIIQMKKFAVGLMKPASAKEQDNLSTG